jgi:pseudouridine synthase
LSEPQPETHSELPEAARRIRLNRYLALAGLASRRAADRLIAEGRVEVNGALQLTPGLLVLPGRDHVLVDGHPVEPAERAVYLMLHKPVSVVTTLMDPQGRRSVRDLLPPERRERVFPVGRLDRDSEGLLLLTNDGELAHRLLHPRYHVDKRYRVRTDPAPRPPDLEQLAAGVEIEPGVVTRMAIVDQAAGATFEILIREGKKRQIRRMCEVLGLKVTALVRIGFGPLALGSLPAGAIRELEPEEVRALEVAAGLPTRKVRR